MPHRASTKYSYSEAQYRVEISRYSSQGYNLHTGKLWTSELLRPFCFSFLICEQEAIKSTYAAYNMQDIYASIYTHMCIYVCWESVFVI